MREYRLCLTQSIGLVPTMGALHKGHQSLIKQSIQDNAHTIVSIFVNPTQFGANEDFDAYPRDLEKDIALCEQSGVDAVFIPSVEEMYRGDEITLNPPKKMGYVLEGFDRPTHFAGVLQVVLKLFSLIQPHRAYFGQKDAQQVLILQKMISDLFLPIVIVPCPIVRDDDGLAFSSRNIYLSPKEREIALRIPQTIQRVRTYIAQGITQVSQLESLAFKELSYDGLMLFYATFRNHQLEYITHIEQGKSIFLIAAKVGKTRLIDNLWI